MASTFSGRARAYHPSIICPLPCPEPLALEDTDALAGAMRGCAAAYYLVHSMIAANDEYRSRDSALAASFAVAAQRGAVGRIIYLGGLGELGDGDLIASGMLCAVSLHLKGLTRRSS